MLFIDLTTLLAIALLVYAWWPGSAGRSRWTGRLIALCLLSPGLRYLSALFTFPIRLQLSQWAGGLLRMAGLHVQVEGNLIVRYEPGIGLVEMAVDPACVGLQVTGASLLVGLFAIVWHERASRKNVRVGWLLLYEGLVFGLTIGCNLVRIVLLVAFNSLPGTWTHELIGLACVAVYAWWPSWGIARWLVAQLGQPESTLPLGVTDFIRSARWGLGLLVIGLSLRALAALPRSSNLDRAPANRLIPQRLTNRHLPYTHKVLPNGFIKYAQPGLLIYLKPQPDWFSVDHSPLACWQGSGYECRRIRETTLDGHPAYVGELRKRGRVLYTAWWFSNGPLVTISQFSMRQRMLTGQTGFALVNITRTKPFN